MVIICHIIICTFSNKGDLRTRLGTKGKDIFRNPLTERDCVPCGITSMQGNQKVAINHEDTDISRVFSFQFYVPAQCFEEVMY